MNLINQVKGLKFKLAEDVYDVKHQRLRIGTCEVFTRRNHRVLRDPTYTYEDKKRASSIVLIESTIMRKIIIVLKLWRIKT